MVRSAHAIPRVGGGVVASVLACVSLAVSEDPLNLTFPRLRLASGTWTERRMLAGDEVREYLQVDVQFQEPVYVKVCDSHTAVYLEAPQICADCPLGCILSNLFSRTTAASMIVPADGQAGDCLCGLDYEDLLLRAQGLPGDLDFTDVERQPPIITQKPPLEPPFAMEPYAAGLWQFSEVMMRVRCPADQSWPELLRYGLNSMPVSESLWWLRRFDTAFGVEDLSWLLGNVTMSYDLKRVVFFLPLRRTRNGRTRQLGPTFEQMRECPLEFPFLVNGQGDPAESIPSPGDFLQELKTPCHSGALEEARRQIDTVLSMIPNASKQTPRCTSDWRTSFPPRQATPPPNETSAATGTTSRARKRGALAYMNDFLHTVPISATPVDCQPLRWQLKLKAHNLMERALAYTALDSVAGCWNLLESIVRYEQNTTETVSQNCQYEPDNPLYWTSPCCNRRLHRDYCCAVRNLTVEKSYPVGINETLLAQRCRIDPTGGAQFVWSVTAAAMAWRRRVEEDGGFASCQRQRMVHEHAHTGSHVTVERCHAEVMGQYDREMQMYVGKPCFRDSDCFTRCVKPSLPTLQVFASLSGNASSRREAVGRCWVPTTFRHGYLWACYAIRAGPALVGLATAEMGLGPGAFDTSTVATILSEQLEEYAHECIGPYAARGVAYTEEECLAVKSCNWNHRIDNQAECERDYDTLADNTRFCSCVSGWCPQVSNREQCVSGLVPSQDCENARKFLWEEKEESCLMMAETAAERQACDVSWHDKMLRACMVDRCNTHDGFNFYLADDVCVDVYRGALSTCLDDCRVAQGPNPVMNRETCWLELWPNESAEDCYRLAGDGEVHWETTEELRYWSPFYPQGVKPRYCSIRVWSQFKSTMVQRDREAEANMLSIRAAGLEREAERVAMQWEAADREQAEADYQNPPPEDGCAMGLVALGADTKEACRARGGECCLSPIDGTRGLCTLCTQANFTICYVGELVEARWPRNLLYYEATVVEDLDGVDYAELSWATLDPLYSTVTWSHIRLPGGRMCASPVDGCAAHDQCRMGEYCFSCDKCRMSYYGGNPPPSYCAPCETRTGGACGDILKCDERDDSIDGSCPEANQLPECPCKEEWSVRNEYDGAPSEGSIQGCYFDVTVGYRWCEVYSPEGMPLSQCPYINRISGQERFIYWRECVPDSCMDCNCNCTQTCEAYNWIPVFGRAPYQVTDEPGTLDVYLPPDLRWYVGKIAPNCSEEGDARKTGDCDFCVQCCADYCHGKAAAELAARPNNSIEEPPFDCTTTNVTGCADLPRGWRDSEGRTCVAYASQQLCTDKGAYGEGWPSDPPRLFEDYRSHGRLATESCCDCGGGAACADDPNGWTDPHGRNCQMYTDYSWCNRSGYGPNWTASWGVFEIGTDGKDATGACCQCGGGMPLAALETTTFLVDQRGTCLDVWPGRTVFDDPPWLPRHESYCRFVRNVCFKEVDARVDDPASGGLVPDNKRIYEICEQRAYETGRAYAKEDTEVDNTPGAAQENVATELTGETVLYAKAGRELTNLSKTLYAGGTSLRPDWHVYQARGACVYQLPDPLSLAGGPRRDNLPPLWLSNTSELFIPPSPYLAQGWPPEFINALPVPGEPSGEPSSKLRGILMQEHIEVLPAQESWAELDKWHLRLNENQCLEHDMKRYIQERYWQPGHMDDEPSCLGDRCNIDPAILDATTCEAKEGCTKSCSYCSSRSVSTLEQGMCYTTHFADEAACAALGGVAVEGDLFIETLGVTQPSRVCALLHRPLQFCVGPDEAIKRCAHFDDEHCESDPLAKIMECALGVRQCQTVQECDLAGRCSDEDIGLTWALPGTCIITPLDDKLLYESCEDASEYCYFKVDPPIGAEVRKRHGLMDLLGPDPPDIVRGAGAPDARDQIRTEALPRRLRGAGRLTREECDALSVDIGRRAIYMEASHARHKCVRWESCCLSFFSDRCELFSGPVIDSTASPEEAAVRREDCAKCGGEWMPVFMWYSGEGWTKGQMQSLGTQLYLREWASANEWALTRNTDSVRKITENAAEGLIGLRRKVCVECFLSPLFTALATLAASCGVGVVGDSIEVEAAAHGSVAGAEAAEHARRMGYPDSAVASVGIGTGSAVAMALLPEAPQLRIPAGTIVAPAGYASRGTAGSIELRWHELSASDFGLVGGPNVEYSLAVEPWEPLLATAACQLAQPGAAEYMREQLSLYAVADQVQEDGPVATTPPPGMISSNPNTDSAVSGYPQWLVEDLINEFNPDLQRQTAAAAADQAERIKMLREEAAATLAAQVAAADAASGLSEDSLAVLQGIAGALPNASWAGTPGLGLDNASCHNVVINSAGEPIGQSLGDCVFLNASTPLTNAVELCLPASNNTDALNATPLTELVGGLRFDFGVKGRVPQVYNVTLPPELQGQTIPGDIGYYAWQWRSSEEWGRLKPGYSKMFPLWVDVHWRKGGSLMCAKVYEAGVTYCPVVRLDTNPYFPLPKGTPPLHAECLQLDSLLRPVHFAQAVQQDSSLPTGDYVQRPMQVVHPEELQYRQDHFVGIRGPPESSGSTEDGSAVCPAGSCLAFSGRGFQLLPAQSAGCTITC